ncbi:MAG: glycerol-3-phosphate dehydrogenase subunit GlpB [Desulfobacterales bacterium]|nr:glycerol-3-phosphate dehydrogenase subunit GlpB [Desulfobacterales bacterium]
MNYDCIIIGGGLSGLICGIKCLSEGLNCAIISAGMNSLNFSSGSIDLLGFHPKNQFVNAPFACMESFIAVNPFHPYATCGIDIIEESLYFFKDALEKENLTLFSNGKNNHFTVTAVGAIKPTFFSQIGMFNEKIKSAFERKSKIAIINIQGYRDFYPLIIAKNLVKNEIFKDINIITGSVDMISLFKSKFKTKKNPYEFRSIDIARFFEDDLFIEEIANKIIDAAKDAEIVAMPAFFGKHPSCAPIKKLEDLTGRIFYEIPTLPPSICGMRLDEALKSRFTGLGGIFIAGDKVVSGKILNGKVEYVSTENYGASKLKAKCFVLSTGSFFSGGIKSGFQFMKEPLFNLQMEYTVIRRKWYNNLFFDPESHPFFNFGVKTDYTFRPYDNCGKIIENLFCSGAILANYNPIKEGSGGGVAISTGYKAAKKIIEICKK